ncbi:hypothetical protein EVAR_100625_1 [Eumeta japonica]|uniref:Uncharacterized protein n=1 Tax=Eumeta variegata TaxID=151549 RepID=A0A4C1ZUH0_EUMVA|nr:hypothetical protein EVAR_100625_1 [Eumeta japonica]
MIYCWGARRDDISGCEVVHANHASMIPRSIARKKPVAVELLSQPAVMPDRVISRRAFLRSYLTSPRHRQVVPNLLIFCVDLLIIARRPDASHAAYITQLSQYMYIVAPESRALRVPKIRRVLQIIRSTICTRLSLELERKRLKRQRVTIEPDGTEFKDHGQIDQYVCKSSVLDVAKALRATVVSTLQSALDWLSIDQAWNLSLPRQPRVGRNLLISQVPSSIPITESLTCSS